MPHGTRPRSPRHLERDADGEGGGEEERERHERRPQRHLRRTAAEVPVALVLVVRDRERARRGERAEDDAEERAELDQNLRITPNPARPKSILLPGSRPDRSIPSRSSAWNEW